jgi:thiamine-monophosphate kinase
MGTVEKGRALLRSGARPGDTLCVTGCIGDAALGLLCLDGTLDLERELANDLSARYQLPEPRLELGRGLIGLASACADISDGLVADVGHISAASDVSAVIEKSAVPLSAGGTAATRQDHKWWQRILGGGDDYELAFTVSAERLKDVRTLARDLGVPVSPIGRITAPTGDKVDATVIDENGAAFLVKDTGYRHR